MSSITTPATEAMKRESVASSTTGSLTPSRERRLTPMDTAPMTMPTVSMHQMMPTARGLSCSLVRSITRAR